MKMMTVVWIFLVKRLKRRRRLLKVMQQLRHLERRKNGWRYNFLSTTNSLAKCLTKPSIYIPIKIQKVPWLLLLKERRRCLSCRLETVTGYWC
ncbi:hypothetical protein Hdeb2414_s0015g00442591 [Helianthus debilis subsp. tardiflorus]